MTRLLASGLRDILAKISDGVELSQDDIDTITEVAQMLEKEIVYMGVGPME